MKLINTFHYAEKNSVLFTRKRITISCRLINKEFDDFFITQANTVVYYTKRITYPLQYYSIQLRVALKYG